MNVKTILVTLVGIMIAGVASAEEAAAAVATTSSLNLGSLTAIGLGIAALGGALGQGKATAAALEGIARNPAAAGKIFTPMIIGLALIESLVLYAFVIAFLKG